MESKVRQIRVFSVDLTYPPVLLPGLASLSLGADMAPRCVGASGARLPSVANIDFLSGLGLQDVPQLTGSETSSLPNPLTNHAEHSGHPFLSWEPSSGPTALGSPKAPRQGVTWKTSGCSSFQPWEGLSQLSLALRDISIPWAATWLRGRLWGPPTHWAQVRPLALTSPTIWDPWPRSPFFIQGEPQRHSPSQNPPYTPRSLSTWILSLGQCDLWSLTPLSGGQTACLGIWGLWYQADGGAHCLSLEATQVF